MTAQVINIKPQSVKAITKQTKAAWDRADASQKDADEWLLRTGKLLVELKASIKHGEWGNVLKEIGRSQQRAHELMQLAGGKVTVEEQRESKRQSVAKSAAKAKVKSPQASGDLTSEEPAPRKSKGDGTGPLAYDEDRDETQPTEEQWQFSLATLCGEILARRAYWTKTFGAWEEFEYPSHIETLMKEAATEFASIVKTVTTKRGRK